MNITHRAILRFLAIVLALCMPLAPAGVHAQDVWPQRPIKIVVPYAPGASSDNVARRMGQALSERLRQSVIVENRTGAAGAIGAAVVAKEKPDGYTLLAHDPAYVLLPHLSKSLPYDPNDLIPIGAVVFSPFGIIVKTDSRFQTLQDLVAYARANPKKVTFGSGGEGSSPHLASELFASVIGAELYHVPYKGAGEAVLALLGGQIDMQFVSPLTALGQVKAGKVRMLAISGAHRVTVLPGVPTFAEAGVKDFGVSNWIGFWAPRGTPVPVLDRLKTEIAQIMATPEMKSYAEGMGADPRVVVGDGFVRLLDEESTRWIGLADKIGLEKR